MSSSAASPLTVLPQFDNTRLSGDQFLTLLKRLFHGFQKTRIRYQTILSSNEERPDTATQFTAGSSEAAHFVCKQTRWEREQLLRSISLGSAFNALASELLAVVEHCAASDWNGYGAAPITATTASNALRFADVVPVGLTTPSIGAEPDGSITFEWHANARRTLSVSIDEDAILHYAALIGSSRFYGSEAFVGVMPPQILDLIYRIWSR